MAILKSFMESRVNNWLELEKLISKAIDFASNVSKNGINKVVISSITISDTKAVFNLIYSSTMTKINENTLLLMILLIIYLIFLSMFWNLLKVKHK